MGRYNIERTDSQIEEQLNKAMEAEALGTTQFPNCSYEEGVRAALDWLFGKQKEEPID